MAGGAEGTCESLCGAISPFLQYLDENNLIAADWTTPLGERDATPRDAAREQGRADAWVSALSEFAGEFEDAGGRHSTDQR